MADLLHSTWIQFTDHSRCHHKHQLVLLPQPGTKTFVIFADVTCPRGECTEHMVYSRYDYDGNCLATRVLSSNIMPVIHFCPKTSSMTPVGRPGLFRVRAKVQAGLYVSTARPRICLLQFNEHSLEFTAIKCPTSTRLIDNNDQEATDVAALYVSKMWIGDGAAWWKDTFYASWPNVEGCSGHTVLALLGCE